MAEVYLATQQSLHRKVAVKVLLNHGDQEFNTRFIHGHIVASLHNPSIITIYDIKQVGLMVVITWRWSSRRVAIWPATKVKCSSRNGRWRYPVIVAALAVVHAKGLIHRDIKPANILFRKDGTAVLTDFGIAKDMHVDMDLTNCGVAVGSPAHSSPEQTQCLRAGCPQRYLQPGLILLKCSRALTLTVAAITPDSTQSGADAGTDFAATLVDVSGAA